MPIHPERLSSRFGGLLNPSEAQALIDAKGANTKLAAPTNPEEKAISLVVNTVYEALIRSDTTEQ